MSSRSDTRTLMGDQLVRMIQRIAIEAAREVVRQSEPPAVPFNKMMGKIGSNPELRQQLLERVREAMPDDVIPELGPGLGSIKRHRRGLNKSSKGTQKLFSPKEVATRLGVTMEAVYNRQGRLKLRKRGKGTSMTLAHVIAWEKERAARPGKGVRSDSPVQFNGASHS